MGSFSCWGWSDISQADATKMADERTRKVAALIASGERPDSYHYADRPIREPILQEWRQGEAEPHAAITRNAYGCEVLNTTQVMFVDVDIPDPSAMESLTHRISKLFGSKTLPPKEKMEQRALSKLQQLLDADSSCGVRIYRTRGGLRYLFTHQLADPTDECTLAFMDKLGADPLYVQLCKSQECFRARLTPKPWRCGHHSLKVRFPWVSHEHEGQVNAWLATYTTKSQQYSTCELLSEFGPPAQHPWIAQVVEIHDRLCRATEGLPLA